MNKMLRIVNLFMSVCLAAQRENEFLTMMVRHLPPYRHDVSRHVNDKLIPKRM